MEEFVCQNEGCGWSQKRQSLEQTQLPDLQQMLWATVAAGKSDEKDQCKVQCPECRRPHQQCLHCKYSFLVDDNKVLKRSRYTPVGYMNKHLGRVHGVKRRKVQHGDDQVTFDDVGTDSFSSGLARLAGESAADGDDTGDGADDNDRPCPSLASRHHSDSDFDSDCSSLDSFDDYDLTEGDCDAAVNLFFARSEEETRDAVEFAGQYEHTDLDPDCLEPKLLASTGGVPKRLKLPDRGHRLEFDDFAFFDWRETDESRRNARPPSQVQAYFYQRYLARLIDKRDDSGGFRGLLHRLSNRDLWDLGEMADKDESREYFRLFNVFVQSQGDLKNDLILLCHGIIKLFTRDSRMISSVRVDFPSDIAEARRFLTDGNYSLLKHFPVPNVFAIDGHACVSLKEVILLAAGHGAQFNFAREDGKTKEFSDPLTEGFNATDAVSELVEDVLQAMKISSGVSQEEQRKTKIGFVYFWSDGFLNCFIKQKDNSVWIFTVTICPPEEEKSSGKYTYVLAMGQGGTDHTKVVEHYMKECQELMQGFQCYFGNTNTLGRMAIGHLYSSADRPETQEMSHTMKEGTYGKVSGWSAPIDEEFLPACAQCHQRRLKEILYQQAPPRQSKMCGLCANWTFKDNEQRTVSVPKAHPFHLSKVAKRSSGRSQLESQENDTEQGHPKMQLCPKGRGETKDGKIGPVKLSGEWLTQCAKFAYSLVHRKVWKPKEASEFLRSCNIKTSLAVEIVDKALADSLAGTTPGCDELIPFVWTMSPDIFGKRLKLPEMPMHGLAHGIIPDVMNVLHRILAHFNKFTEFVKFANPIIEIVATMRLDYCKVKQLPKAAWVAENVMGYARMIPYLYGMFLSNVPLQSLESRQVEEITKNMRRLLNSLGALCSILMSRNMISNETVIDNHMKLFMSSADMLHGSLGTISLLQDKNKGTNNLIAKLTSDELNTILAKFSKDTSGKKASRAKQVQQISKVQLLRMCTQLELEPPTRSARKIQLQILVFGKILRKSLSNDQEVGTETGPVAETDEQPKETTQANPKKEKRCWHKGAWLSFTANIPGQIHYMGPCPLLW